MKRKVIKISESQLQNIENILHVPTFKQNPKHSLPTSLFSLSTQVIASPGSEHIPRTKCPL